MALKRWIATIIAAGLGLGGSLIHAQPPLLCGKVVAADGSPAAFAVISLGNRVANAGSDGSFCFQHIGVGEYDVVVQWGVKRFLCRVVVSRDNLCKVPG